DLITYDWQDAQGIWANGVNGAPQGNYPNCANDLQTLQNGLNNARTFRAGPRVPFTAAQTAFAEALLRIMLRANGLTPQGLGVNHAYSVTMKSSDWWNSDHFAIGIQLPPNNRIMYVQTVPYTSVCHGCDVVWDELLPDVSVGIAGLLQIHVDYLNRVPLAPCRDCGETHGWLPSVRNSWHQCRNCGAVFCPEHGSALLGKGSWYDGTRTCSEPGCGGRTRLV
ncbi:MAG TPA: hypothetical protein VF541_05035, partial [Longimicrobium sp.]